MNASFGLDQDVSLANQHTAPESCLFKSKQTTPKIKFQLKQEIIDYTGMETWQIFPTGLQREII